MYGDAVTLFNRYESRLGDTWYADNAKDPLETMTKGRVYVTVNDKNELNTINYYGTDGKRVKAINLTHNHGKIKGNHVHEGYYHDENGTRRLTAQEKRLVEFVKKVCMVS